MELNIFHYKNFHEFLYTIISFFIFFLIYIGISVFIKQQNWPSEKKHKYYISTRNLLFFIFIINIVSIWSGEIKTFIFSAAAIFGAALLVFKEVLLAITGFILTGKSFSIGDYIEFDGVRGKVIDRNFFNTTILISDQFQNRELIFTNMHYITSKIINLSKFGELQSYSLTIGVNKISLMNELSQKGLLIAQEVIEPYKNKFQDYFKQQQKEKLFFEIPDISPKLTYQIENIEKPSFTLHYISHPLDKSKIENEIVKKYLAYISERD